MAQLAAGWLIRATCMAVAVSALLMSAVTADAQTGTAPAQGGTGSPLTPLKGQLIYKNFSHFYETDTDHRHVRNEGILLLEWAPRLRPWLDLKLVGEARADDDRYADELTFQIPEKNERRSYLNLKEAVATSRWKELDVSAGKQFFAWGTADAFNPTDNLNAYDFLDPIDNEKIGVYSLAARWTRDVTSLTFVVAPFFTPSRTPLPESRWFPASVGGVVGVVDNREIPGRELENMQYAARVRSTIRGWDVSASYFDGFEHTPVIKVSRAVIAPGVEVPRFTPVFTRVKVVGMDFSTAYRNLELHGETTFRFAERNGRDDRFQAIIGANYTWSELGVRWLEQINLIVEYANETIMSSDSRSRILPSSRLNLGVPLAEEEQSRHDIFARVALKLSEDTQLEVRSALNFAPSVNHYAQLQAVHKITDALHVTGGFDLFGGSRDTFWGRWRDNDRFYLFARYYF